MALGENPGSRIQDPFLAKYSFLFKTKPGFRAPGVEPKIQDPGSVLDKKKKPDLSSVRVHNPGSRIQDPFLAKYSFSLWSNLDPGSWILGFVHDPEDR